MIAHVAEAGEGRGRVVLHLTQSAPNPVAVEAAVRVARAFQSEIESLFVEDSTLLDIAAFPFACEISLCGRHRRDLSPEIVARQMRAAAAALTRRLSALAQRAEIPLHVTVVRNEPVTALAEACAANGPWNVVALGEPISGLDAGRLAQVFAGVPGTTGLIVVGPRARRSEGRIVAVVEDIGEFDAVLRTARRLHDGDEDTQLTLLLVSDSEDEARLMDEQARLALGDDDSVEIVRARVETTEPGIAAEVIRKLSAGFIVGRFGGLLLPSGGNLRPLAAVLECPLFLMR
ncbi:MAG: hypothetical protein AB7E81_18050 [Hyphomicrobiaceae bacterium]